MNRLNLTFIILFFSLTLQAQNSCDCQKELDFVSSELKNIPSFKSQHKKLDRHNAYLAQIKNKMANDSLIDLNCLSYLQRYLKVVNDQHNYIINGGDTASYRTVSPRYQGNINDLETIATTKDDDPLTGVYNLLDLYRVAVISNPDTPNQYFGYLLNSSYENWEAGEIKFSLSKEEGALHGMFYNNKHFPWYKAVSFKNGRLYPEQWIQESYKDEYLTNPYDMDDNLFVYKNIKEGVHYIRLGDFDGSYENFDNAMALLDTLKSNMKEGNLIIDLRNNGGGGRRVSDPFVKFLKGIKKNSEVHILQNNNVGSNSEQFILKLKDAIKTTTYGENTRGVLAYGFGNYASPSIITPCYGFTMGLTKKKYERFLEYEGIGITPDFPLDFKSDWVAQVVALLGN